ncbi:unnamed protein product [Leuciscus chuanchicus]
MLPLLEVRAGTEGRPERGTPDGARQTNFGLFFFSFFHYFLIHPSLAGVTPINESRPQVNTALASESIPVTCNTNTQKLHLQKIDIVLQTCPITTLSLLLYSSADINALSCEHIVTGEYSA